MRANLLDRRPGLIRYSASLELQRRLVEARKAGTIPDVLLFCEHPHVITLGRNGKLEHLRAGDRLLAQMNVEFQLNGPRRRHHLSRARADRRLSDSGFDRASPRCPLVRRATRGSDDSRDGGFRHRREASRKGGTGFGWSRQVSEEKLAALGVHLSRWITSHGFAYNVSTDLALFRFDRAVRDCGSTRHVAGTNSRARRAVRRSSRAPGVALWRSVRAPDGSGRARPSWRKRLRGSRSRSAANRLRTHTRERRSCEGEPRHEPIR